MIEIQIGENGLWPAFAYLVPQELEEGERKIYVGDMSTMPEHTDFVIDNIEAILIHESSHILIHEATQDIKTTHQYDNIDNPYTLGGVYPCSSPF